MARSIRCGFTLIEMLTVMALLTIILGIGAIIYHDVMTLSSAQGRYEQRRASAEYFLRLFAKDVRRARAMELQPRAQGGPVLTLQTPELGQIAYSTEGPVIQRALSTPQGEKLKRPVITEPGIAVRFDLERVEGRARSVVATVEWEEPPSIGVSHPTLSLRVALRGQP